jgi:hypothetical protein
LTGVANNLPAIAMTKTFFMKKFFTLCLLFPFALMAQNIYTVSNVPGTSCNYKTLQGAHDSVAAGSIIYVLPGAFSYGDLVLTKKLTIYGTGYFLGQNLEPNTQASSAGVYVNSITFRAGSDNSYVEGLQMAFQAQKNTNRFELDTVSNIIISRCYILSPTYGAYGGYHSFFMLNGANNCTVKQCYIENTNGYTVPPLIRYNGGGYPNFSGIRFTNNIIDWQPVGNNSFNFGPDANGTFQPGGTVDISVINNTFLLNLKASHFANLNYTNNIFYNDSPADIVDPAQVYLNGTNLNNVCNSATLFTAVTLGNNFQSNSGDSLFVSGLPGYHSKDQRWTLRDASFANSFGQGGVPAGAIGGASSYKLSGIPNQPFIYNLTVPAQATAPGTLTVHIKAMAAN